MIFIIKSLKEYEMFKSIARFWHNHIRIILSLALDCAVVFVLLSACYFIFSADLYRLGNHMTFWTLVAIAIPTYLGVFTALGLYKNLWSYAQPREYLICNVASIVAGFLFYFIVTLFDLSFAPVFTFFLFNMFADLEAEGIPFKINMYRRLCDNRLSALIHLNA